MNVSNMTYNEILEMAAVKWLPLEVIESILLNYGKLGFQESHAPPFQPKSGQLYLFDREKTKSYKMDGVNWMKKKGQARIRETYHTFKVEGEDRVAAVYSRSAESEMFQRRIYRMAQGSSPIAIVHYRDCSKVDSMNTTFAGTNHSNAISDKVIFPVQRISNLCVLFFIPLFSG